MDKKWQFAQHISNDDDWVKILKYVYATNENEQLYVIYILYTWNKFSLNEKIQF